MNNFYSMYSKLFYIFIIMQLWYYHIKKEQAIILSHDKTIYIFLSFFDFDDMNLR